MYENKSRTTINVNKNYFSLYQEILPGAYIQFGTGKTYPNHNPNFKVDPSAISPTAKYIASLTEQYLKD